MVDQFKARPYSRHELAQLARKRVSYQRWAQLGKYLTLVLIGIFVLSLVLVPGFLSGGNLLASAQRLVTIAVLYNALWLMFLVTSGVWIGARYMETTRSFVDEGKVELRWRPLLDHRRYQELKAAQGGVLHFQFEQMKKSATW